MNRKLRAVAFLLFCLTIIIAIFTFSQESEYKNAIYIYMCGSDLETHRGCATDNISELLAADIPDDTCIIIMTGGARRWRNYDISDDHHTIFRIDSGGMTELKKTDEKSMGRAETLYGFLTFCQENYLAKNTGIIFWNHGSGSIGGICYDENFNMDPLTLSELSDVLGRITDNGLHKYDFIGFDACLMANYDTVTAVHDYADYMIASEELEPLGGWDYTVLAEQYGRESFYQDVLDSYVEKCIANEVGIYTLSCIDLIKFEQVEASFEYFCRALEQSEDEYLTDIVSAADEAISFGYKSEAEGYSNMFDLAGFAANWGYSELTRAIEDSTLCVNSSSKEGSSGISIFYPLEDVEQVDSYIINGGSESYNRFLIRHYSDIPLRGLIEFDDAGSNRNNELYVSVTQDSMKYVKSIDYKIFQIINLNDEEQMALCFGTDTDIIIEDHSYITSFEGKWVTWNNEYIYTSAIETNGSKTTYSTPVLLNGQIGTIRFVYDIAQRSFTIQGFLTETDTDAMSRLQDILEGDEITLVYQEISSEYEEVWCLGKTFLYSEDRTFVVKNIPESRYLISLRIKDVFGNVYRSNTALVEYKNGKLECIEIMDDIRYLKFRTVNERS